MVWFPVVCVLTSCLSTDLNRARWVFKVVLSGCLAANILLHTLSDLLRDEPLKSDLFWSSYVGFCNGVLG